MAARSKVQLYEQIRRAHAAQETKSIRALARQFRVHRRDVRAALESAVPPPRKTPERPAPKMDRYKPIIDGWLEEDQRWPRKQRHTARRVWQRLVSEHQADVGESTVRRYVRTVRERQSFPLVDVTVPQHHPLGSKGEVDFGEAKIMLAGIPTDVSLFVMRLSASGRGFCRAYLNETQDVFLDGHVRAFDHFGGVPGTVSYDNLKAAVTKVLKGRTGSSPTDSPQCGRTMGSSRGSANRVRTARMRRAASRARSAGSVATTWFRSHTSRPWKSSTS
jgi:transposase